MRFAFSLLQETPRLAGETRLVKPPADLRHASSAPGVDNLVTRARYWTSPRSAHRTYLRLKHRHPPYLDVTGYGDVGAGGGAPGQAELDFTRHLLPTVIDRAEVFTQIKVDGPHRSVVAAFAQVVPYPVRPQREIVPVAGSRAVVTRTRYDPSGQVIGSTTTTLDAPASVQVVRSFNALLVQPPGACFPSTLMPSVTYLLTITASGHSWTVRYPRPCDLVGVRSGKQTLPQLDPRPTFRHLLYNASTS